MRVVVDSSPLIALCLIGQLPLLKRLFEEVYVAPAVYFEVVEKGKGRIGSDEVRQSDWIKVKEITNTLAVSILKTYLDSGEAKSIVLSLEMGADLLILDEKKGRDIAEQQELKIAGTAAILKWGVEKKIIFDLASILDKLQTCGFRLSKEVYNSLYMKLKE